LESQRKLHLSLLLSSLQHTLQLPENRSVQQNDPVIKDLCYDSRKVVPGSIFFAIPGLKEDGFHYVQEAITRGAVAVVTQQPMRTIVPCVGVKDVLPAMSQIADVLYEHPSQNLHIVGVTGTNGKTTVSYFIEAIWKKSGKKSGLLGTVNYRWNDRTYPAPHTTALSVELQRILNQMTKECVRHVVMEVSSHALALHRVNHVDFDVAVFTNLSQDHLDFHGSLENYFESKALLFRRLGTLTKKKVTAVINGDDPYFERIVNLVQGNQLLYGMSDQCHFRALNIKYTDRGTSFDMTCPEGQFPVKLLLVGRYNVHNALAAAAAAYSGGTPIDHIIEGLVKLEKVPGRLERIDQGQDFSVFVDYAHTDDALSHVLETLRPLTKNKLLSVFGCGGDRDRGKRPLMGKVATSLSDYTIITSDNPRSENPEKIAQEIKLGIESADEDKFCIILERQRAIEEALRRARQGDVVVIAGKGHETMQIFSDRSVQFDDREVTKSILTSLGFRKGKGV